MRYRLLAEIAPRGPWVSLRLIVDGRAYSLSWNGYRLAQSRTLRPLYRDRPLLLEEVVQYLEHAMPGDVRRFAP